MILEALKERKPCGFIMCDWNMPGMNGIELLKNIRDYESIKSIPFLMVTAENERSHVTTAISHGVTNFVAKPVTPEILTKK